MKNGKLVSIKLIADTLMQNPLLKDLSWEFIVSNAVECMRIVGTPAMFVSKEEVIQVKNFKGSLPIDIINVNAVMKVEAGGALTPLSDNQDTLAAHYDSYSSAAGQAGGLSYTLNNSRIFPNFEEGKLLIIYKAIATDEECYPLIPDNQELIRALRAYIKYQWFDILNDLDKISGAKLQKAEIDYSYYVGQAQSNLQMPDEAEMESLVNSMTKILPSRTEFQNRFKFLGSQEFLKIQ